MRKYAAKIIISLNVRVRDTIPQNSVVRSSFLPQRCMHITFPQLKRKDNKREENKFKKQNSKNQLESAEEWLDDHDPPYTEPKSGNRSSSLEETDLFEMDDLTQKLKDALDRLRKDGNTIKQGRSDPELIRGLQVELPEELGGKTSFLEIATIGPKPGDARQLLMTVFDTEVMTVDVRAYGSILNIFFGLLHRSIRL